MKICVPTTGDKGLEERAYGHFGSAPYFTLVDLETAQVEVVANKNEHHSHGSCHPMASLLGKDVDAVVVGGMGRRAIEILNAEKIKVYKADGETVRGLVQAYKEGKLVEVSPEIACTGHGCH